jgi:hypothetical protein
MANQHANYRGDRLESLEAMSNAGHLFGPDMCGPGRPGEILGHGAYYELVGAEYDPETDMTRAEFKPHVRQNVRERVRYFGGDGQEVPPPDHGEPTLHTRDNIRRR